MKIAMGVLTSLAGAALCAVGILSLVAGER